MAVIGRLDRRILIQRQDVQRDALGGEVVTWVDVGRVWANRRVIGVTETFNDGSNREITVYRNSYRIRHRDDVDELMRIVDTVVGRERAFDIHGLTRLPEFGVMDITTQGNAFDGQP